MVSSLQNTSKESRIGAYYEPEESTEELEDDNSFSITMESFFEGNSSEAMKEFRKVMQAEQSQNTITPAQNIIDY
eukprot:13436167-Ditylum_brightwellii.AAC.1